MSDTRHSTESSASAVHCRQGWGSPEAASLTARERGVLVADEKCMPSEHGISVVALSLVTRYNFSGSTHPSSSSTHTATAGQYCQSLSSGTDLGGCGRRDDINLQLVPKTNSTVAQPWRRDEMRCCIALDASHGGVFQVAPQKSYTRRGGSKVVAGVTSRTCGPSIRLLR